jgi:acyl-CoA oxidase
MSSAETLKRALTIAVRYSARRIHHTNKGATQILDYQAQQQRLMPLLAATYALHFTGKKLNADYVRIMDELSQFNLSNLPDFHATSAGLKAFSTWHVRYLLFKVSHNVFVG